MFVNKEIENTIFNGINLQILTDGSKSWGVQKKLVPAIIASDLNRIEGKS